MSHGTSQSDHPMVLGDALRSLTRFVSRRPRLTLWIVLLVSLVCIASTVTCLQFKTKRADLINPDAAFHRRWINYTESFGEASDMVVVVEANDPETIKQVIDDLGARMQAEPDRFSHVLYKVEPGKLLEKGLQYLSPEQLDAGLGRLEYYRPVVQGRWDHIRLDALYSLLRLQIKDRMQDSSDNNIEPVLQHAALLTSSLQRFLADRNDFLSPWPDVLPVDRQLRDRARQVTYFLNDRGTMGFLKAFPVQQSSGFDGPSASINRLRELVAAIERDYPIATVTLPGIPVLENDEMRRSQADMLRASLISFAGVGLLLFVGFRGFRHPLMALLMLTAGMSWTFGYTTLAIGHLNILSISFAAILIGLGIDFAIHYLARYLQLRHEGYQLRPALQQTSAGVGIGIVTAALTTSLAFLCASLTNFLGVAELGIIAGGGILLCAVATFVVLPALVTLADDRIEPQKLPTPFQGDWLRRLTSRRPLAVTLCSLLLIGIVGGQAIEWKNGQPRVRVNYDYNLLNLQAKGIESVEVQKRLFQQPRGSLLFAVSLADTPEQSRNLRAQFEQRPTVDHVEELGAWLPSQPQSEIQLRVQGFAAELARIDERPPKFDDLNPANVGQAMEEFYELVRDDSQPAAVATARSINAFLDEFENLSVIQQTAFLNEFQHRMAAALLGQFQALRKAANAAPVTLADLPDELTSRFVSSQGKWLVQIYPKEQIWDFEPLERFVTDVRKVDPDVTGTPLQNYEASQQIMDSYQTAALYALMVISLVLLVDFLGRDYGLFALLVPLLVVAVAVGVLRYQQMEINTLIIIATFAAMAAAIAAVLEHRSVRDTLLALFPPLGGGLLMFGILAILKVDLNPANLIVLPLVLGIGVDDGVHVIHDFRSQRRRYRTSPSTINAIVLTSLTSMIGFGSMMIAAHRGLYSLGLVLVVGVGGCLFVSLVSLPAILTLISNRQQSK